MMPIYIFDLDGTLANTEHRVHLLSGDAPDRWDRFYDACVDDEPNTSLIELMKTLLREGHAVWIWTGRSERVHHQTLAWLDIHVGINYRHALKLKMRPLGDHTQDHKLKRTWLSEIPAHERVHIAMAFEDRSRVVEMWRCEGILCCQVQPGDF